MKDSKLYSILYNKCPRCHQGHFFIYKNPLHLKNFDKQYNECPVCRQSFNPETGFYYGAMYVSYGLDVAWGLILFGLTNVLFDFGSMFFLISYIISLLLLWTTIYRKARLIWINLFIKYDKTKAIEKA
ncbi:MAG: DUF983 domain-containing protein [Bacteroidetes bacterium]|nr:DUF983 domain-containing protein [Bacteroidota bacterium]